MAGFKPPNCCYCFPIGQPYRHQKSRIGSGPPTVGPHSVAAARVQRFEIQIRGRQQFTVFKLFTKLLHYFKGTIKLVKTPLRK